MPAQYPLPVFHFTVEWGGTRIGFSEVTGLTQENQAIEYRDGSFPEYSSIKMPGLRKFTNIVMKRGIVKSDNDFFKALGGGIAALGPLLAGALLEGFDWWSVFIVTVPLALAALAMAWRLVPAHVNETTAPVNHLGGVISVVLVGAQQYVALSTPRLRRIAARTYASKTVRSISQARWFTSATRGW